MKSTRYIGFGQKTVLFKDAVEQLVLKKPPPALAGNGFNLGINKRYEIYTVYRMRSEDRLFKVAVKQVVLEKPPATRKLPAALS